jgi:hypothetical protein
MVICGIEHERVRRRSRYYRRREPAHHSVLKQAGERQFVGPAVDADNPHEIGNDPHCCFRSEYLGGWRVQARPAQPYQSHVRRFDRGIGAADDGEQVGNLSGPSDSRRYPLLPARDDARIANPPLVLLRCAAIRPRSLAFRPDWLYFAKTHGSYWRR